MEIEEGWMDGRKDESRNGDNFKEKEKRRPVIL